jgi:UDP-N-acetylmuramoylalanine--D-glutamate ligase
LYGLGREGLANLRACRARGVRPVLVDDVPRDAELDGLPVLPTAAGGAAALEACEVVIKTPGISAYAELPARLAGVGVAVVGGLGLWLAGADLTRVICVTGTKGKSTTTAIAGHLITGLGQRCLVAGNIGVPPFDPPFDAAVGGQDFDWWVVEVSSYQAVDVAVSPPVVGVTSLHPDHLPWHRGDAETYYRDKLSLCTRPGADLTVANGDDERLRARRELLGPRVEWVHAGQAADAGGTEVGGTEVGGTDWTAGLGLIGVHNRRNALIARELMRAAGVPGADDAALASAAKGFHGLESRLQVIGELDGVTFVDDSLSTNVLPTLAAVEAFPGRRVALIVGGQDRGIDYAPLAEGLRSRQVELLLVTVPDNGPAVAATVRARGPGPLVTVTEAADLAGAVCAGFAWARPGGVVLLSPAAASFGVFTDYRDRGAAFAAAMATCAG